MNRFLTRKTLVIAAGVIILIIAITSAWSISSREDEYAITEEKAPQNSRVSVDFSRHEELFTPAQRSQIETNLLNMTIKEVPKGSSVKGIVRESSVQKSSDREVQMIIDSEQLQTSYVVSRFVSPEDNLDIVNVVCVDESQRIYKKDHCRGE